QFCQRREWRHSSRGCRRLPSRCRCVWFWSLSPPHLNPQKGSFVENNFLSRLQAELALAQPVQENEAIHRHANRDRRAELKRQVFVSQPHVMPSRRNLER